MSRVKQKKSELIQAYLNASRQMGTQAIMFHQAVADQLGLNTTDHKCLDLLNDQGPLTAGQLAELTGLTTGAITGVIDRLEDTKFVRRVYDEKDRRKVIIEPVNENIHRKVAPLFDSLAQSIAELCSSYTATEIEILLDFHTRCQALFQAETRKLRNGEVKKTGRRD